MFEMGEILLVYRLEYYASLGISFALVLLKGFALVQSLMYSPQSYLAADKLNKPMWIGILFFALLFQVLLIFAGPFNFLQLAFTIAALVFLCDVKPAVAEMQGGR
ncbi:MAG: DUF2516 family protein [Nocardioides sp.]